MGSFRLLFKERGSCHKRRASIWATIPAFRTDAAFGHPDMVAFRKSTSATQNEAEMGKVVDPVTQPNGLMEFTRFDLGEVLRKENGIPKAKNSLYCRGESADHEGNGEACSY
jgi:hypothetical protein